MVILHGLILCHFQIDLSNIRLKHYALITLAISDMGQSHL
jgi:hypothetical protein